MYLHGVGDLGTWLPVLDEFGKDYRVIRPDHAGFNGSDDFPNVTDVVDLAYLHLDLLDVLGVQNFVLMGCSFGGWVASQMAILAPTRVTRLLLIDPAGISIEGLSPNLFHLSPTQSAEMTFSGAAKRAAAVARAQAMPQDETALRRYHRNRIATALVTPNSLMNDPKLRQRLHRIKSATLIVWGVDDQILPRQHAEYWSEAFPSAQIAMIDGAGHLPHVEKPIEFASLAHAFLDESSK